MDIKLQNKLSKLYQMLKGGSTDGEKAAAKEAIDRIVFKYDLDNLDLDKMHIREYRFKYSTELETWLFQRILKILLNLDAPEIYRTNYKVEGGSYVNVRDIVIKLDEVDYITLHAAYEYFRGHMKSQWKRHAAPVIKRCRTKKTKSKKREDLKKEFFSLYIIKSKLYEESELKKRELKTRADYQKANMFNNVEGGKYNTQVNNGLYLEK